MCTPPRRGSFVLIGRARSGIRLTTDALPAKLFAADQDVPTVLVRVIEGELVELVRRSPRGAQPRHARGLPISDWSPC